MVQITIMDNQTKIETEEIEIYISGDFEIKKRSEIKETPVAGTTDVIPPPEFPLLNHQEYQRIYKEAQQEVPKEEKN